MNIDRAVFCFAGSVVIVSLVLSQLHSVYWLLLTAFVGLNMIQASFSGFCPIAKVFKKLGMQSGSAF